MTSEQLATLVGGVIAALLGWFPVLKTWFDKQQSTVKAGVAAALTVVLATAIYFANCQGWYQIPGVVCGEQGLGQWVTVTLNALIGLVAVYIPLVRPFKKE
jgi:hypothetical protein